MPHSVHSTSQERFCRLQTIDQIREGLKPLKGDDPVAFAQAFLDVLANLQMSGFANPEMKPNMFNTSGWNDYYFIQKMKYSLFFSVLDNQTKFLLSNVLITCETEEEKQSLVEAFEKLGGTIQQSLSDT